jgi:hypothetical protein
MKVFVFGLFLSLLCGPLKVLANQASFFKMKSDKEALFCIKGDFVDLKIIG